MTVVWELSLQLNVHPVKFNEVVYVMIHHQLERNGVLTILMVIYAQLEQTEL
jgi:hypothetical protein